eukprot:gene2833-4240_t
MLRRTANFVNLDTISQEEFCECFSALALKKKSVINSQKKETGVLGAKHSPTKKMQSTSPIPIDIKKSNFSNDKDSL